MVVPCHDRFEHQHHLTSMKAPRRPQSDYGTLLSKRYDGGITRDLEVTDHLDGTGAGLRQRRGLAAQHGTSGAFGVERIALTMLMPQLAVGTTNLEDLVAICLQGAGQSRTVGTGAFDAEGPDGSEGPGPSLQIAVAGTADRDGHRPQPRTQRVDDGGVGVLVGVDADYDLAG